MTSAEKSKITRQQNRESRHFPAWMPVLSGGGLSRAVVTSIDRLTRISVILMWRFVDLICGLKENS
jgi:hypothetical protein